MNKLIIIGAMVLAVAAVQPAFASEVTGTLSNDPSKIVVNPINSPSPENSNSGRVFDWATMLKIALVVFLLLELAVLFLVPPRRKVIHSRPEDHLIT